jgi:hypothetical protein
MNLFAFKPNSPEVQSMVRAYMGCLLWTMPGQDDDENAGDRFTGDRFTAEARIVCTADCLEFLNRCREAGFVTLLYGTGPEVTGYGPENMGHDLALSRNGHGAGFFDRRELEIDSGLWSMFPKETGQTLGDALQDIARDMGERDCYCARGWVYVS